MLPPTQTTERVFKAYFRESQLSNHSFPGLSDLLSLDGFLVNTVMNAIQALTITVKLFFDLNYHALTVFITQNFHRKVPITNECICVLVRTGDFKNDATKTDQYETNNYTLANMQELLLY